MKTFALIVPAIFAAAASFADYEVISDQLDPVNLSFPRGQLKRYLAAYDFYANYPGPRGFFHRGLGMPAPGSLDLVLDGKARSFRADYTLSRESPGAVVVFKVLGDGKELWRSPVRKYGEDCSSMSVDVAGVKTLTLAVEPAEGNKGCPHACWGEIRLTIPEGEFLPCDVRGSSKQLGILTPPPAKRPRINGARVLGVRPGRPVLFRIPATGERPLRFSATAADGAALPAGLSFDSERGILTGALAARGDYALKFRAENAEGADEKPFMIRVGDDISLTPAMGWNSWNAFGPDVSSEKVIAAAETMVATGLADHGWTYVNIDDFWENNPAQAASKPDLAGPGRLADGTVATNSRFPDMKALTDRIHAMGLRAGLYSSPGPLTCGGCIGSFGHEAQDAATYAKWGFDYLKYDHCSYRDVTRDTEGFLYPFLLMGRCLKAQNRDIVYSFNPGNGRHGGNVWGTIAEANSWRISGDVFDTWASVSAAIELGKRVFAYSRPGRYNDPDMLCVGPVRYNDFRESRLSPNEQYTHISLWSLMAAPLMIGCDMTKFDAFTLSLLTNDEVIEIDQDELGAAAGCIDAGDDWEVWARPMADGSVAAGLFNKSARERRVAFDLEKAGLLCKWRVRDVWRQEDVGVFSGAYEASVPGHATHLVRLWPLPCGKLREGMLDVRDGAWRHLGR